MRPAFSPWIMSSPVVQIADDLPFQAVEYFQRVISMQQDNGEVWSALGTSSRPLSDPAGTNRPV